VTPNLEAVFGYILAMDFDVVRGVSDLGDRAAAWRFIGEFANSWLRPLGPGDGVSDVDLDAAQTRLGVRLPAAVREAYRMFGRRDDLTNANGTLLPPARLDYDVARQLLVFRAANQGVEYYAVSLADPANEDPPVMVSQPIADVVEHSGTLNLADVRAALAAKEAGIDPDEASDGTFAEENWVRFLDRFSLACVDMVLWEALEPGPQADGRDLEEGEPASLITGLTELPFPRHETTRWYAGGLSPAQPASAGSDVILRIDEDVWVQVLGRDRATLNAFRDAHPGFWLDGFE
jgi:hypothetical protein